ncbi:hypothetical protein MHYP_G00306900 [Metynnis hypsauchen]
MSEKRTRAGNDHPDTKGKRPKFSAEKSKNKKAMDSQTAKACKSRTRAEEIRNQTKLVMQPYVNWEEYLTPAPLSIAILGQLVFISSQTDFSMNKNPPRDGYKHIKYPDSFCACLIQVYNSGWWAFNEAHKNMYQIQLHTIKLPDYMKTAVKILFQGDDEIVKALLPDQLEKIYVRADDCLALADTIEKRFSDIINIIQELLEACTNDKHIYGEELEEIKKKLKETKPREQTSKEVYECTKKGMNATEKELQEGRENNSKAVDFLPSGWDMICMDFVAAPLMFKKESKSESMSASERATKNVRFRIEQSRAQLNKTRELYEKSVENMEKNQKELTEILMTMRNCEVKEIDFKPTIQMLVKGMDAMRRVKEQWEKLVCFFQMMSRTLKDFVSTSEKTQSLSYNSKLFFKDLLYSQAFQATNIASLAHMISETYTEVSDKYLMDRVSSLGKLMAMDKENPEFLIERLKLQSYCDEALKGISCLVLNKKHEFERRTDSRLERIDKVFLDILPSAAPEEMTSIQADFDCGRFKEEDFY